MIQFSRSENLKEETIEKIKANLEESGLLNDLPQEWHGFHLRRLNQASGDVYDICVYGNEALHKYASLYFHEETHEYKLRLKIGLIEFCRIEFITASIDTFVELLHNQLESLLVELTEFHVEQVSSIVRRKKILEWDYTRFLPAEAEGFSRYISPDAPIKINNGSYIIADYVDFDMESGVTFYYNIYRDEFFSEARIWNIPNVTYEFDSSDLEELEEKLRARLMPRLMQVRAWAEKEAKERMV